MDKLTFSLALSIYLSVIPLAQAQSCVDIINQVRQAIPASPNTPPASLWNLTWLQGRLGQADTSTVVETHYQWQNGDMLARDNTVVKTINLPDAVTGLPSAQDVLSKMGSAQHIESTILAQYRWVCTGNSTYLEVLMEKGKIVFADGQTCTGDTSETCTSFRGSIALTNFESKLDSAKPKVTVISPQLKTYNDYFKTTINNDTELSADMVARLKDYLANLRQCRPGTYQYATPEGEAGITFVTSIIRGLQDSFCLVETEQRADKGDDTPMPVAKCQYQQQNLAVFADVEAENLIKGNENPQIEKIQETQCRVFLNGQEIPLDKS